MDKSQFYIGLVEDIQEKVKKLVKGMECVANMKKSDTVAAAAGKRQLVREIKDLKAVLRFSDKIIIPEQHIEAVKNSFQEIRKTVVAQVSDKKLVKILDELLFNFMSA